MLCDLGENLSLWNCLAFKHVHPLSNVSCPWTCQTKGHLMITDNKDNVHQNTVTVVMFSTRPCHVVFARHHTEQRLCVPLTDSWCCTHFTFANSNFVAIKFKDIFKVSCMKTSAKITYTKIRQFLEKCVLFLSKSSPVSSVGRAWDS